MANDTWRTPPEVIRFIENKFGEIKIDLCSSDENKVCELNITESDDFLDNGWLNSEFTDPDFYGVPKGELTWCNPPYSKPLPFIKQCVKWAKNGYAVAGILNIDPSTKWFVELVEANAMIMPIIGGRISFLDIDGNPSKGNNKPQFIFYLTPFLAQKTITEYVHKKDIYLEDF